MPPREVRKIINSLFQEGIIDTQEVPNKSGNMVTLFSVNFNKIKYQYYIKMVKKLLKVKVRMEDLREKLNEKLTTWTGEENKAYETAIAKLEFISSHLEKAIMIFNEF
mmetsp:Transcript_17477/g.15410  ORF Transcript_17477/g.15410 Transcript_17477/m.15410 type:complete len:108 (+) Transcript_17477:1101-1424(+)